MHQNIFEKRKEKTKKRVEKTSQKEQWVSNVVCAEPSMHSDTPCTARQERTNNKEVILWKVIHWKRVLKSILTFRVF